MRVAAGNAFFYANRPASPIMENTMNTLKQQTERLIEVTAADLPLHCPQPGHEIWNAHPRVFLPIDKTGEVLCPYCGTLYRLSGPVKAHH